MKSILFFIFVTLLTNVYAQNIEDKTIKVREIGKHSKNNFLNLAIFSKKIYYFKPNGLVSKIVKYGRHHYAYLSVIGRIKNFQYDDNIVIEIAYTTY